MGTKMNQIESIGTKMKQSQKQKAKVVFKPHIINLMFKNKKAN